MGAIDPARKMPHDNSRRQFLLWPPQTAKVAATPNGLENIVPTQVERILADDEFIISKTDTKGKITYGNRPFNDYSGFSENAFLGVQHNIVGHPDMPRAMFKLP